MHVQCSRTNANIGIKDTCVYVYMYMTGFIWGDLGFMHVHMQIEYMTLIIHEMLRRPDKAIQHNSPKAVIFQRKSSCLGWDSPAFQATCT